MAGQKLTLGFADYLKEAFLRKVRVPGLGGLPANVMALGVFGVLGLINPGFWLLGAAGELLYLSLRSSSARFQKLVQGERLLAAQKQWEQDLSKSVTLLSDDGQLRYKRLLAQCRAILSISEKLGAGSASMDDMRSRNLNQLLVLFLRLQRSQELIHGNLKPVERSEIQRNVTQLEKQLATAGENEPLRKSLEGTLAIQQKRMENLERAIGNLKLIEAEMLRIEQQVELLKEEAAMSGSPMAISQKLDTVTTLMDETNRFMQEHSDVLGTIGGDATSEIPDLPRLPGAISER